MKDECVGTPARLAGVPMTWTDLGYGGLFERGDRVMRGGRSVETVRNVLGPCVSTEECGVYREGFALLPPDADGDLVAIISALAANLAMALRRRAPSVQYALHTSTALLRVAMPDTAPCDATPMAGGAPGSNGIGFLAIHECAYAACYGATPRAALHWLASMLYHQSVALGEGASPVASWAEREMATAGVPLMERSAFVRLRENDPIEEWIASVNTMAEFARAASAEAPRK